MTSVTTIREDINGKAHFYGVLVILDSTTLKGTAVLSTRKRYVHVQMAMNAALKLREDVGGPYRSMGPALPIVVNSVNMLKGVRVTADEAADLDDTGDDDPLDENPTCPQCGGPGVPLGTLGKLAHFRCRNCGWDFSADLEFK
jgi:hypothetical protein